MGNIVIPLRERWYHTNDLVFKDDVVRAVPGIENVFGLNSFRFERLRCLTIYKPLNGDGVRFLNQWTALEQLELQLLNFDKKTSAVLVLPELRVLFIDYICGGGSLTVDTPHLKVFACLIGLKHVHITNPRTVQHLQIGDRNRHLFVYKNTRVFKCDRPYSIGSCKDMLRQLPNLNAIHLDEDLDKEKWRFYFSYKQTKNIMNNLMRERRLLNRTALKIYFFGKLLDGDTFEDTFKKKENRNIFLD